MRLTRQYSARAAGALALGLALCAAASASGMVRTPPALCDRLERFARVARDGRTHEVELTIGKDDKPRCAPADSPEQSFCRWLQRLYPRHSYGAKLFGNQVTTCLGQFPSWDSDDPDEIIVSRWFIGGNFTWESDELARARVKFEFHFDAADDADPKRYVFRGSPL